MYMASVSLDPKGVPPAGPQLLGAIAAHGTASHPYAAAGRFAAGPGASRDLADAVHFLCMLHGRHPGVIELVANHVVEPAARPWLAEAAEAFAGERNLLAKLVVAAGPLPATPGQGSESAVAMQRAAVMTLAQSERRGTAIGAALGIAGDWTTVRTILSLAAERFGLAPPTPWTIGAPERLTAVAEAVGEIPALRRAMLFGAEQVAVQHRGLMDLLAARALAREGR